MERPLFSPFTLFSSFAQCLEAAFSAKVMDGYFTVYGGDGDLSACDPVAHITVNPGDTTPAIGTDLGASGVWLNVSNFDGDNAGNFRVVIE